MSFFHRVCLARHLKFKRTSFYYMEAEEIGSRLNLAIYMRELSIERSCKDFLHNAIRWPEKWNNKWI